jgi:hypothetical protein
VDSIDALKRGLFAVIRAARPTLDYAAFYRAEVIAQSGDRRTVDVKPDDARLPPMSKLKLRLGIPGATVKISPGAGVMVGWENADPQRPYVHSFDKGADTITLSLVASKIELGAEGLMPNEDGIVRAATPCQFTGAPHFVGGLTSLTVMAKK